MSSPDAQNNKVPEVVGRNNPFAMVTVFVCTSCGLIEGAEDQSNSDGRRLHNDLKALAATQPHISIQSVDCLAVCDKSVTIAFTSPQKWTYVIGGVDAEGDSEGILSVAHSILKSESGVPAMIDRPPFFRKGVISRLPPVPFR
ncbi:MAG: DUF1636 domain-containing protein [Sneathiella sp.]|uniref:DUF1636 domain-containing protein n=1 Tax=Sneathiella sp. TaxID=1964365 RepID=UPI0030031846